MRTMHPVLKRGGLYWDRDLLPPAGYDARFHRIQAEVAASGDDAWLVYGDVERYGSLAYFSNFLPRTRSALALIPREGAPTLLISVGQRDVPAAKTLTWIDDVRPFTRLPKTLVSLIEEKKLTAGKIGLVSVEELLPIKEWNEITKSLPGIRTARRTTLLDALRGSKEPHEIEALRGAAKVVAGAFEIAAKALAPGRVVREALSQVERYIRANGAEDVRIMVASGEQTLVSMRPMDSRVLQADDVVLLYVAAEVQRYWAEGARTFVLGEASLALRELAKKAGAALEGMRDRASPGGGAARIAMTAEARLPQAVVASANAYGFGNGIGLDLDEPPYATSYSGAIIADNSAFALRIICCTPQGGIALGETAVVLGDRVESLTGAPALVEIR